MMQVRKLFRAFWRNLGRGELHRRLSLARARLLVEPLEERWLLDAHNLLWIGPQDNNSNMSYAKNWIDLNTGGYFAPVAGNSDSITFDPAQVFNNTVPGSDSDATDDIPNLTVTQITMAAGFTHTITLNNKLTITPASSPPQQPPASLIANGSIGGSADLVLQAGLSWTGGKMFGSGTTYIQNLMNAGGTDAAVNASLTINAPEGVTLDQRTLDNQAKTTWTDGNITTITALIENDAGQMPKNYTGNASFGEFEIAAGNGSNISDPNAPIGTDRTNSLFSNDGYVLKDGAFSEQSGTTGVNITFNNDSNSSVRVAGAALSFRNGGTSSGNYFVEVGGLLVFASTLGFGYTWNSGTQFLDGGDTSLVASVVVGQVFVATDFTFASGTISGPGTIKFSYLFHWTGGSFENGGTAEVLSGATATAESIFVPPPSLLLSGWDLNIDAGADFEQDGANIAMGNGALINNLGDFSMLDDSGISQVAGVAPSIFNLGTFLKVGGTGTSQIDVFVSSFGITGSTSGKLRMTRGFLQFPGGLLRVDAGAGVDVVGTLEEDGGAIAVNGGTLTVVGTYWQDDGDDTVSMAGASNTGGVFNVTGTYEQDAGTMTIADSSSQLTTSGVLDLAGGTLTLDGGSLTADGGTQVASGAVLIAAGSISGDVTTAGTFYAQAGGGVGSLTLAGNFTQAGGATTVYLAPFTINDNLTLNAGAFDVNGGGVPLTGSFQQAGGTLTLSGGSLVVAGDYLQQAGDDTVAEGGNPVINGGLLSVGGTYEQDAGTMTIADTSSQVDAAHVLNLQGGTLTLDGDLSAGSGTQVAAGAVLLVSGGTIHGDVTTAGTFGVSGNAPLSLALYGSLTQTGGGVGVAAGPGGVTVYGSFVQTGGQAAVYSSLAAIDGIYIGNSLTLEGGVLDASVDIALGGSLGGFGTVTDDLTNAGSLSVGLDGTLATLSVGGNYSQTGSLGLAVDSRGFSGHLVVAGVASLGGTLDIVAFEGQPLYPGGYYDLVTAGTLSGGFASVSEPPLVNGYWAGPFYSATDVYLQAVPQMGGGGP